MRLPRTETEYLNSLVDAAELGARKALQDSGLAKSYISLREAYRLYGTGHVKRWIKEGLISPIKDGVNTSTVRIDKLKIEAVSMTSKHMIFSKTDQ